VLVGVQTLPMFPKPLDSPYTSCYCEENIYLLVRRFLEQADVKATWDIFAVIISNVTKTVNRVKQNIRTYATENVGCALESTQGACCRHSSNLGLSCCFSSTQPIGASLSVAQYDAGYRRGNLDLRFRFYLRDA
jgi:hypothetical protein